MADNSEDRRERGMQSIPADAADADEPIDLDEPIELGKTIDLDEPIDLDDIAVGTSDEDQEIIELTEEVVDEAIGAVSSATGSSSDDRELDLSGTGELSWEQDMPEGGEDGPGGLWPEEGFGDTDLESPEDDTAADDTEDRTLEADISRNLDDFFSLEDKSEKDSGGAAAGQDQEGAVLATPEMLDAALERVVQRLYEDKIEKILKDMIEKRLSEDMSQLKQYLREAADK